MFGIASHMPISTAVWYAVHDDGEYRYRLQTVFRDASDQAADAGEDYWNNHDGWESKWPLTFFIYESEDGPPVGAFEVEMETVPQFSVRELPQSADAVREDVGSPVVSPREK
jgi:hypothetical protein